MKQYIAVLDKKLDEGRTDGQGWFRLSGSKREITTIDPKVNIYHKCGYRGMHPVFILILTLLPLCHSLFGIGRMQSVAVMGTLQCNGVPASNVKVKLYEKEVCELSYLIMIVMMGQDTVQKENTALRGRRNTTRALGTNSTYGTT
ncbi:Transthyretin-like family protein [Ostertagia ostertagi]